MLRSLARRRMVIVILTVIGISVVVNYRLTSQYKDNIRNTYRTVEKYRLQISPVKTNSDLSQTEFAVATHSDLPHRNKRHFLQDIDCRRIIQGNVTEVEESKMKMNSIKLFSVLTSFLQDTLDCNTLKQLHGYHDYLISDEERNFPLAFNILFYKDLDQVEFLLRTIYRPHNFYCLHVDGFSPLELHKNTRKLADCFDNVFVASKTLNITYAGFNRLQADIYCMEDHLALSSKWKYLLNLPGQEFPLKTNAEIVNILKVYNNSNDIEGFGKYGYLSFRYKYVYKEMHGNGVHRLIKTNKTHVKPPHNLHVYKGSAYGIFSRQFVDYIVNNEVAHDLLEWCRYIKSPDEYYWSTLNHNPSLKVPGGLKGSEGSKNQHAVYVAWVIGQQKDSCFGKLLRNICVFGVGDLHNLTRRPELFANKFEIDYQPAALQCLSEWIYNKSLSPPALNLTYYSNLPFIDNHF